MPGLLILDNNCFSLLAKPGALKRFRSNLRVSDFIAQPSEVNLLEAGAARQPTFRKLVATIREVLGDQPLLPWPFKLLQQIGQAISDGIPHIIVEPSGKEWYLEDQDAAIELQQEVLQFQQRLERDFCDVARSQSTATPEANARTRHEGHVRVSPLISRYRVANGRDPPDLCGSHVGRTGLAGRGPDGCARTE